MSVNLYYKPIKPCEKYHVNVTACQVRRDLKSLFGDYPITLTRINIPELKTLQSLWLGIEDDSGMLDKDPFKEIIDIVKREENGIELFEENWYITKDYLSRVCKYMNKHEIQNLSKELDKILGHIEEYNNSDLVDFNLELYLENEQIRLTKRLSDIVFGENVSIIYQRRYDEKIY